MLADPDQRIGLFDCAGIWYVASYLFMNPSEQFSRLKSLLEQQETFPFDFTLKFIGRNSDRFQKGISRFENDHPVLRVQSRRESSNGNHLAMTYVFSARNAEHIIATLEQVAKIEDVMVIL